MTAPRALLFLGLALAGSCGDPSQFLPAGQSGGPKGVLDGAVIYTGPLPCTESGHIVGAAVILVFDVRKLPPPEGTGSGAASLAVVGGDELFAGVRGRLTFNLDEKRWCPKEGTPPVTVSGTWTAAPLDAGAYQVRGFYDRDGNFDPNFSIANLPTKGDVAGGALDNLAEAAAGGRPRYREITLGLLRDNVLEIPPEGARIGGVTVNLALSLPRERPLFYLKELIGSTSPTGTTPTLGAMPADYQLKTTSQLDPVGTEESFIRLRLGAGVRPNEAEAATKKPFYLLPLDAPAPTFFLSWQDVNGDGTRDIKEDHIPESALVPALFPLAVFSRLVGDGNTVAIQQDPQILIQGITLDRSLLDTAASPPTLPKKADELVIAVRPAALCLPAEPGKKGFLIVSHKTDAAGNLTIASEGALKEALRAQFHRDIDITYTCLPQGSYALSLIDEGGQAWTVPNEAGVCSEREPASMDGTKCVGLRSGEEARPERARLASQSATLRVDPPKDPASCTSPPPDFPPGCLPAH